jgi:hypothetical protein
MPTLAQLRRRHPEHKADLDHWQLLTSIVQGGRSMDEAAKQKLLPNPDGRPMEVVKERVKLATYTNKIGPILTRFNSQLFSQPPTFSGSDKPFWEVFRNGGALLDDDDDARASFNTLLSRAMFAALTTGKAIAQIDTRIASGEAKSLEEQSENGELEPYVILHPRSALWDWKSASKGFQFAKLHAWRVVQDTWDAEPVGEHDFTIFQRQADGTIIASRYTVRKRPRPGEKPPENPYFSLDDCKDEDVEILPFKLENGTTLENQQIFSVGGKFEFPIVSLTLPPSLCIADQLFECQKSFFSQTAALEYAMFCNNYAMLVVLGVEDEDDDPLRRKKVGEGFYLTLKPGQSLTSFERSGTTITTAINYRAEIKRDIYDQLQQIAMSAADGAAIIARSGESKREDRRPEQLLLSEFGRLTKEFAVQILRCAAIAHGEDATWKAEGLDDFMGEGILEEIADIQGLQLLPMPSPTFKRETMKYLAQRAAKRFSFASDKTTTILKELDSAADEEFEPPAPMPEPAAA